MTGGLRTASLAAVLLLASVGHAGLGDDGLSSGSIGGVERAMSVGRDGVAAAPAFTPASLTSLKLWVKSDTGITIATGVSQWDDLSGNGNHLVQATGASQPVVTASAINGLPAITFDGVDDFMQKAFTLPQPVTIFMVVKEFTKRGNETFVDGFTANTGFVAQTGSTPASLQSYGGSAGNFTQENTVGSFALLTVIFNGAYSAMQWNSAADVSGSAGTAAMGGLTVGGRGGTGSFFANAAYAEIIVQAGVATAAERTSVETYVSTTYALGLSPGPTPTETWVFIGDSITAGSGSQSWPNKLHPSAPNVSFVNAGGVGFTTSAMLTAWTNRPAAAATPARVFILAPINNINADQAAATALAPLTTLMSEATALGAQVIALQTLPFGTSTQWTAPRQTQLDAFRSLFAAASDVDLVVDLYPLMGEAGTPINMAPAYRNADGLHPNEAGTAFMAATVATALGL